MDRIKLGLTINIKLIFCRDIQIPYKHVYFLIFQFFTERCYNMMEFFCVYAVASEFVEKSESILKALFGLRRWGFCGNDWLYVL